MIMASCIGFLPNTRRDFTQGKIAWVSEKEMPNVVCLAKCGTLELFNNSNQEVLSFGTNNGEFAEIITEGRYHLKYYKTACVCYLIFHNKDKQISLLNSQRIITGELCKVIKYFPMTGTNQS